MDCESLQAALTAVQATIAGLTAIRDASSAVATASAAVSVAAMAQAESDATAATTAQNNLDNALSACDMYTAMLTAENCPGYGA
jgi:hypothetical protein